VVAGDRSDLSEGEASGVRGVIIADVMGLGKSLQGLCTILVQNNDRERSGMQDHLIWGPPLPNFVICPKSVITEWLDTCNRSLSGNYNVIEYRAKAKSPVLKQDDLDALENLSYTIYLTTYDFFRLKHCPTAGAEHSSKALVL
jgi:SNF2 family DNA or RNA helicase